MHHFLKPCKKVLFLFLVRNSFYFLLKNSLFLSLKLEDLFTVPTFYKLRNLKMLENIVNFSDPVNLQEKNILKTALLFPHRNRLLVFSF